MLCMCKSEGIQGWSPYMDRTPCKMCTAHRRVWHSPVHIERKLRSSNNT